MRQSELNAREETARLEHELQRLCSDHRQAQSAADLKYRSAVSDLQSQLHHQQREHETLAQQHAELRAAHREQLQYQADLAADSANHSLEDADVENKLEVTTARLRSAEQQLHAAAQTDAELQTVLAEVKELRQYVHAAEEAAQLRTELLQLTEQCDREQVCCTSHTV